jgi:c-di-GMP-binding flagellar brake protein YcgR
MNDAAAPTPIEGDGLYEKYMLHHPADVRACLRQLIDKHSTLLVHAPGTEQAVSVGLAMDDTRLWIDVPRDPALAERLISADRLRIESSVDRITVRFATGAAQRGIHGDLPALEVPLPLKVMHLQRREYVRREPIGTLVCRIPVREGGAVRQVRASIADIGGGGLAVLSTDEIDFGVVSGDRLDGVTLDIPDQGTLTVSLCVQHAARFDQQGRKVWRAGCSFLDLTVQDQAKLLRYVMQLDRMHMARQRGLD